MSHRIVIVGGGFGGVAAALALAKHGGKDVHVTLINKKPWLEYYGVLYRLITRRSFSEACIPLKLIFASGNTEIVIDTVTGIDAVQKSVRGSNGSYPYDTLILALGSMPAYFNIPGMEEHSITMGNVAQATAIGERVRACVDAMTKTDDEAMQKKLGRFLVVGAGPTGIEIAGEILPLARRIMREKGLSPSFLSVDVIEGMPRVLPMLEEKASAKVLGRLIRMGVNVHLNTMVASADAHGITFKDGTRADAETLIWTAGVKPSPLLATVPGLELDKHGRAVVDEHLRANTHPEIFVIGDCASTPFAGMAQTAVVDGEFVSKVISAMLRKKPLPTYKPKPVAYAIPAGPRWAAVKFGFIRAYGFTGSVLRRLADIHVYMLILPWRHVLTAFLGRIDLKEYEVDPLHS